MKKGFTLVEIIILLDIIGFLCAISIPSFINVQKRHGAQKSENNTNSTQIVNSDFYSGLQTIKHDEHLFIVYRREGGIIHHPDCPCRTNNFAEIQ